MKIAYIITRLDEYGGPQIHIRDLCIYLGNQGHKPVVISGMPGRVSDFIESMGTKYIPVPEMERSISALRDIRALFALRRVLRRTRPDIVSCHSSKAGILGRMAAWSLGIPAVFTVHGWAFTDGIPPLKRCFYRWAEWLAARFGSAIITVSAYDRDLAVRARVAPAERMTVIHNGMPMRKAPPRPRLRSRTPGTYNPFGGDPDAVRLLMVARFAPQKDHVTLLRALSGLKGRNWRLALAGNGDDSDIRALAKQEGIEERIDFLGERTDVPELMEQSDIFVLTSHWEGFPRAIIEAMRAALPVVATRVAGVPESVADGETGFLVGRGDIEGVRAALEALIRDEARCLEMGRAGRARYEAEFTFLGMAQKTVALYEEVLRR